MELHDSPTTVANHHAHHPGFSGVRGAIAAVAFLFGRNQAARLAIDLGGLQDGGRLVDIGCGPGTAVAHARKLGAEAIGVDPAPVMLRVARLRWRSGGRVDWRVGTAEELPVQDDWATVVWSLATVHHWADIDAGLAEVRRVLAPGGRFVALERSIDDPDADGVARHGWTPEQAEVLADACRRHGFTNVTTGAHDITPPVLSVVAHA